MSKHKHNVERKTTKTAITTTTRKTWVRFKEDWIGSFRHSPKLIIKKLNITFEGYTYVLVFFFLKRKCFASFLWIEFIGLKATELLGRESMFLTATTLGDSGIHLINLGRILNSRTWELYSIGCCPVPPGLV